MPGWADRTLHRRQKIGFKRVLQQRQAVQAMSCLPIQSPSTSPAVTWRFIAGRLKAWAASIPNNAKPGMTSIFAGVSSRPDGSLLSVQPQSSVAAYLSSIEWFALTIFLFGLGIFLPALRIVPYLMMGGTLCVALSYMVRASIEPKLDTVRARLLVMMLAFVQPLVRGFSRYFTWLRFKRTPANVIRRHEHLPERARSAGGLSRSVFWSEQGRDRH